MKDVRDTRLIVVDMDDTLLHSDKTLSSYTAEVLQRAIDKGILIVPCSGRSYDGLPGELCKIRGIRYAITLNGGVITRTDPREIVYINALSMEQARTIYDHLAVFGSPRTMFTEGPALMNAGDRDHIIEFTLPYIAPYYYATRSFVADAFEYVAEHGHTPVKVSTMIHRDGSDHELVLRELHNFAAFSAAESSDGLEITAAGVDKGEGLRQLCAITGIPIEQTVAFGDSGNDVAMLEAAGTAVVMGNAIQKIKDLADYVTRPNDEDGVAWFIENHIL